MQVKRVARVVLGNEQGAARLGADFLQGDHRGLHAQRQELGVEIVEAAGKQVGVHRGQLETAVAQIHRGIERGRMLRPLAAQPVLDDRLGAQDLLFQFQEAVGLCRDYGESHRQGLRALGGFYQTTLDPSPENLPTPLCAGETACSAD